MALAVANAAIVGKPDIVALQPQLDGDGKARVLGYFDIAGLVKPGVC